MAYPKHIAFIGPIGSGKSACALAYVLYGGQRLSFAKTLRQEVASALAFPVNAKVPALVQGMKNRDTKERFRPLLQWWGQYRRDTEGQDYWVQKLMATIDGKPHKFVLAVDDCRYFNEYDALRERGFKFVRLADGPRPTSTGAQQAAILEASTGEIPGSELEHPYFDCDYYLPWADSVSKRIYSLKGIMSSE